VTGLTRQHVTVTASIEGEDDQGWFGDDWEEYKTLTR
jgi:hypothetical protein